MPLPVGIGGVRFVNDLTVRELSRAAEKLFELERSTNLKQGARVTDKLIVADVKGASEVHGMHGGAEVAQRKCLGGALIISAGAQQMRYFHASLNVPPRQENHQ